VMGLELLCDGRSKRAEGLGVWVRGFRV